MWYVNQGMERKTVTHLLPLNRYLCHEVVPYVDIEEFEILFLITLLEKNDLENLSKAKLKILGQLTLDLKESIKSKRKK
jgi:hypothetical protein